MDRREFYDIIIKKKLAFKGHLLCSFFTRCNKSQVSPECVSSKYSTDHLYNFENADYFEWKKKRTVFVYFSLNANEILLPIPFSRIENYIGVNII